MLIGIGLMGTLIRITAPHFVAGIVTYCEDGRYDYDLKRVPIHRTAPIVKYMKGWTISRIKHYCKKRGWKVEELD